MLALLPCWDAHRCFGRRFRCFGPKRFWAVGGDNHSTIIGSRTIGGNTSTGQGATTTDSWHDVTDGVLALGMCPTANDSDYHPAWREFERRHLPHVRQFVDVALRNSGDDIIDDVLSETMHRIVNNIERFKDRGSGKLRSWCIKIAHSVAKDFWRGHAPFKLDGPRELKALVPFDEIEERYSVGRVAGGLLDSHAITGRDSLTDLEPPTAREIALRDALASLPDVDQVILWGGMSGDSDVNLASVTKTPVESVRKIRYKALKKLAKRVEKLLTAGQKAS